MPTAGDVGRAVIRVLRTRDLPALERLVAELQDYEREIDQRILPGSTMASGYTKAILGACASQAGAIFVADVGGEVVGFAAVRARVPTESLDEPPGSYALLSDLVVSEAHRGVGIGRALIEASEAHARSLGASELRIAVLAKNASARGLYVATGFVPYLEVLTKQLGGGGGSSGS